MGVRLVVEQGVCGGENERDDAYDWVLISCYFYDRRERYLRHGKPIWFDVVERVFIVDCCDDDYGERSAGTGQ